MTRGRTITLTMTEREAQALADLADEYRFRARLVDGDAVEAGRIRMLQALQVPPLSIATRQRLEGDARRILGGDEHEVNADSASVLERCRWCDEPLGYYVDARVYVEEEHAETDTHEYGCGQCGAYFEVEDGPFTPGATCPWCESNLTDVLR